MDKPAVLDALGYAELEVPEVDMLRAGTRSPAPATISNTAGHEDNNSMSIHY